MGATIRILNMSPDVHVENGFIIREDVFDKLFDRKTLIIYCTIRPAIQLAL